MNVTQFSIIIKHICNQLNIRGYSPNKKLCYDLGYSKDAIIDDKKVYIEVCSPEDVLDILKHFNLAWNLKEADINEIIIEKQINTFEEVCLILEIQ